MFSSELAGVPKLYTLRIPAVYNLYSAGIQFVYSRNTFCIQPEYNLYSAGIQVGRFSNRKRSYKKPIKTKETNKNRA